MSICFYMFISIYIGDPVLRTIDGDFLADTAGLWQWSTEFLPPNAVYEFKLDQFQASSADYPVIMGELKDSVQYYGNKMKNLTLSENLLYWTSWYTGDTVDGKVQKFYMFSNPAMIFNREYIEGTVSNTAADCNTTSLGSFDPSNYMLSLVFDANAFINNQACFDTINPYYLGYNPIYDGNDFSVDIDVRSLMTTLAINNHVIPLGKLSSMPQQGLLYDYDNVTYEFGDYYDPRYPGMNPVSCITAADVTVVDADGRPFQYCFFSLQAGQYGIPLFNHFGYSFHYPSYCDCGGKYCNYVYMSKHPIYIISFIHLLYIFVYICIYI